jgi:hypothetical protein
LTEQIGHVTMRGMKKLAVAQLALVLALGGVACRDKDPCPSPEFAEPATAVWTASPSSSGAPTGGAIVVVRWSPTPDDPLPDSYYGWGRSPAPDPVDILPGASLAIRLTAPREYTIAIRNLDEFVAKGAAIPLNFPDTRGVVKCNHPGMADSYTVGLFLTFDRAAHTVKPRFGSTFVNRGACALRRSPASDDTGVFSMSLLVVACLIRRRRGGGLH